VRGALLTTAIAALLVSGCGGKAEEDPGELDPPAGKGGITGVVVDDAIRPITNANVTILALDLITKTDERGSFTFESLEPGTYFLTTAASGFLATQSTAEVAKDRVSSITVQLERDLTPVPYHRTLHHAGFMQIWLGSA
jgi:hypothetical protein